MGEYFILYACYKNTRNEREQSINAAWKHIMEA